MKPAVISESSLNLIAEGTRIEGKIHLGQVSRVHGALIGQVEAPAGSTLIIAENGWVEGNILADSLFIDGFVRGDIVARTRITVSGTGRVIGNLRAPTVALQFGSYFEGSCHSGREASNDRKLTAGPELSPA